MSTPASWQPKGSASKAASGGRKKIRIALIEDNSDDRRHCLRILRQSDDFECVVECSGAEEALQKVPASRPNLALVDIQLGGSSNLTGIQIIPKLLLKLPDLRVLMLTVVEDPNAIVSAICAGAHGYLLKQDMDEKLATSINEVSSGFGTVSPLVAMKLFALFQESSARNQEAFEQLAPRELEVLECLACGSTYQDVADKLNIKVNTVRTHVDRIHKKLQVSSTAEAVQKMPGAGLLQFLFRRLRRNPAPRYQL